MTKTNNNQFTTTDLGVASALFAMQFELTEVDQSNPDRVRFTFESNGKGDIRDVVKKYRINKLQIKAKRFHESTKTLKNIIYN